MVFEKNIKDVIVSHIGEQKTKSGKVYNFFFANFKTIENGFERYYTWKIRFDTKIFQVKECSRIKELKIEKEEYSIDNSSFSIYNLIELVS